MNKKQEALKQFVEKVKNKYDDKIERIILFGSYARGEDKEESDIDVLVLTHGDRFEMQKNISGIAVDILLKTGVYISAKSVSTEEYDFMKKLKTGFYQNIVREGVTVD